MTVRILQFGTTGQLARELLAQAKDFDVAITALSRAEADFADPAAVVAQLKAHPADVVVLAAAYTAVDLAESERELAFKVNAATPAAIAEAIGADGPALVQVSTDYVFPGDKGAAYLPGDATDPINAYGASKLAGEQAILAACPRALILRTSWVVSAHGKNFVKTMLRAASEFAKTLKPSHRGELEITALNQVYLEAGELNVELLGRGFAWLDTGTHDSLIQAGEFIRAVEQRQGLRIGCLEEIAYRNGWIDAGELRKLGEALAKSEYGQYLRRLADGNAE